MFYWRKSDFRVDFWNSSLWSFAKPQNILSFCVSFWRRLWLQKSVENFLCVVRIRSEYVKHSTGSGKCSALWIMTLRSTKYILFDKMYVSSLFPFGLDAASLQYCLKSTIFRHLGDWKHAQVDARLRGDARGDNFWIKKFLRNATHFLKSFYDT